MEHMKRFIVACLVFAAVAPASVLANEANEAKSELTKLWNVDLMMRQAADNIARRYNLNKHQTEQTHKLLVDEVTQFLDTHEDIWPLMRDLTRAQVTGKTLEGDVARGLGQKALPMLEEVRGAILSANERWREILTDEQKQMHDWDLRDMNRTFSSMQERFQQLADGGGSRGGVFPTPNPNQPQPVMPPQPAEEHKVDVPIEGAENAIARGGSEAWWESYVREFIRKHDLDNAQSEAAYSILRECKTRAEDYRKSREKDFKQVTERMAETQKSSSSMKVKKQKMQVWQQIEKQLEKPIHDLFQELKDRLDRIPTDAQKARAGTQGKAVRTGKNRRGDSAAVSSKRSASESKEAPEAEKQPEKPQETPVPE